MKVQYDAVQKISSNIYSNFQKHYCEVLQMIIDDPNCYQDACPFLGGHMQSVHCASKGMVTVMLWRC